MRLKSTFKAANRAEKFTNRAAPERPNWASTAFTLFAICAVTIFAHHSKAQREQANPDHTFFIGGKTVGSWHWVLADPKNWWMPLGANEGKSVARKVSMRPVDYQTKNDAVQITWSRKSLYGSVALAGHTANLAPFAKNAELILVARVDRAPNAPVNLALGCGEDCEVQLPIADMLDNAPSKEWFVMPFALECFEKVGAKLEATTIPVKISTTGRLQLSIAAAFIQAQAEGPEGCAHN